MLNTYSDRYVIARVASDSDILECLSEVNPDRLTGLELLSPEVNPEALANLYPNVFVDVVLRNTGVGNARLEKFAQLRPARNVVAIVPVAPGFDQLTRQATGSGLPVVLRIEALEDFDCEKVLELLNYYVHSPWQDQPIEFFHSMTRGFLTQQPVSMWQIMREDPSEYRYVMDDGTEAISKRLSRLKVECDLGEFLQRLESDLLLERGECARCGFFQNCRGYFTVPDRQFSCTGVKKIFRTLKDKVAEIRREVLGFQRS